MSCYHAVFVCIFLSVSGIYGSVLDRVARDLDPGDITFNIIPSYVTVNEANVSLDAPIATFRVDLPDKFPGHLCLTNPSLFFEVKRSLDKMDEYHLFLKSAFLDSNFRYLWNDEKYFDVPIICAIVQVTFNASGFSTIVTKNIRVNVIDDSDESDDGPVFEKDKYETNVTENAAMGTMIQQVSATDRTSSDNARIEYRLDNNYDSTFAIDSVTGEIFVYGMIDHENITMYILRVLAIDQSSPRLTGYASVRVYVMDLNDNIPQFTKEKFVFEVPRDVSVGTEVGRVTAEDKDSGKYGELYYSLYDGSAMRNIPFVVMGDGVILTDATLDSDESVCRYKFLVVVVDALNDPINCRRNYVEVFVKILD